MLEGIQKIYMVGIKGVGMTSLALIYQKLGIHVAGSDIEEEFATDAILKKHGIHVDIGFSEERITDDIDLVVTSGAHGNFVNAQVKAALTKNIPVMTHAVALGELSSRFETVIAVCGTHGKTTTSSLAAFVWMKLGLACGYQVGVSDFSGMDGGGYTGNEYFIAEADEYMQAPGFVDEARFMTLRPDIAICTNIEYDHPDVYKSQEDVEKAFMKLFNKMEEKPGSILIYCYDDPNLRKLVSQLGIQTISYGTTEGADFQLSGTEIFYKQEKLLDLTLQIPGQHNLLNATAVVALAYTKNLEMSEVAAALSQFTGSARRMQIIHSEGSSILMDDYAHHPTEITATLKALKEKYPSKKIIMLFQPHTYSRTKALEEGFIEALSHADSTYIMDIFSSAREEKPDDVSSELTVQKAQQQGKTMIHYASFDDILDVLRRELTGNDIVLTAGAGDLYKLHNGIIKAIHGHNSKTQ